MFSSWKTSLSGFIAILGGITGIVSGNIPTGATAIVIGIGLILGKDWNKP